jgi:L-rhamnose mutarotase
MQQIAFVLQLKPGYEKEYAKRHDEIWPELVELLKEAGIVEYSIFLHPDTRQLFGVIQHKDINHLEQVPEQDVMKRWWDYMADIMETNPDSSPTSIPLERVFQL